MFSVIFGNDQKNTIALDPHLQMISDPDCMNIVTNPHHQFLTILMEGHPNCLPSIYGELHYGCVFIYLVILYRWSADAQEMGNGDVEVAMLVG
jgi:hypothetical protein